MTTTARAAVDPCPVCEGVGEVISRHRDPHTGLYDGDTCTWCNGTGTVPEGSCTTCTSCAVPIFLDDNACAHRGEPLCDTCALERCAECRADAADDHAADVWMELIQGGAQ